MAKLVAIGDSITQGVMSGAISNTKLSYPALIAKAMGLSVWEPGDDGDPKDPNSFRVSHFPGSGLPLNIEKLFKAIGPDFDDAMADEEWSSRISSILDFIDCTKTSYSSEKIDFDCVYHNLAVSGFRVADSFTISSAYCSEQIEKIGNDIVNRLSQYREFICGAHEFSTLFGLSEQVFNAFLWLGSGLANNQRSNVLLRTCLDQLSDVFEAPSDSTYRIAQCVLNPNQNPNRKCWTQICNLKHLAGKDGKGVENLILFLGANDCLKTVMDLEIKDMKGKSVSDDPEDRRLYNLTSEDIFRTDYQRIVDQISNIISEDTKVFVGTIPHVTIPPITQRVGNEAFQFKKKKYFDYYVPFFAAEDFDPNRSITKRLSAKNAKTIDKRIYKFNEIIEDIITKSGGKNWHLVDICGLLDKLAIRRAGDNPCDDPNKPLNDLLPCNHELLNKDLIDPVPSVLRFETNGNERTNGGIFSLDCFHPTAIGQGLIAGEFVSAMKGAGVRHVDPNRSDWNLDWNRIIKSDTLISEPPELWDDAINLAKKHSGLAGVIHRIFT